MSTMNTQMLETARNELLMHPVYKQVNSPERLRIFMGYHVFAVWDFMSLLKRLQQHVTCVDVPWVPGKDAQFARFVNEIVLGEECDEDGQGGYISHFDLYCLAMEECAADLRPIQQYLEAIKNGADPIHTLKQQALPQAVVDFVSFSLTVAREGKPHEVAAAFFFGREDIIPEMFQQLVPVLEQQGYKLDRMVYYLNRHIELDGDEHGPLARKLLEHLCGDDQQKWQEAEKTATRSLELRIKLWDGVAEHF